MSTYMDSLQVDYRRAARIGQDLMSTAAAEKRDLTAEESQQVDRAYDDVVVIKRKIDAAKKFEDLTEGLAEFRPGAVQIEADANRDNSVNVRSLFANVRRHGYYDVGLTPSSETELRALSLSSPISTSSLADYLTVYQRSLTPMLRPDVVGLETRNDGAPVIFARITADPSTGGTVTAEAGAIAELDSTVAAGTATTYGYKVINLWSAEADQDDAVGLTEQIAFTSARALSIDIGAHLTTGTGSSQPEGFLQNATNGGTATGTGATFGTYFGGTDLIDVFYALAAPYRDKASWMMNGTTLAQVRKSRDTTGQFIWQPAFAAGSPETILGRPVYENPAMANGSAAKSVAVGDFGRFKVVRVVPIRVTGSVDYKFSTDQVALRTIERVGSTLADRAAIRFLVNAAV